MAIRLSILQTKTLSARQRCCLYCGQHKAESRRIPELFPRAAPTARAWRAAPQNSAGEIPAIFWDRGRTICAGDRWERRPSAMLRAPSLLFYAARPNSIDQESAPVARFGFVVYSFGFDHSRGLQSSVPPPPFAPGNFQLPIISAERMLRRQSAVHHGSAVPTKPSLGAIAPPAGAETVAPQKRVENAKRSSTLPDLADLAEE